MHGMEVEENPKMADVFVLEALTGVEVAAWIAALPEVLPLSTLPLWRSRRPEAGARAPGASASQMIVISLR